jgi:hypothetical protein
VSKISIFNFDTPPSEMLSQTLFINYAQRLAKSLSKRIVLFAPTQPEEELAGYDASLIGDGCRELYLQFKRGKQETSPDEIRFKVDNAPSKKAGTKQLDTLKYNYPALSAYYIAGGFWDVRCTLEAQRSITSDEDFLDLYAAVSAHAIDLPPKRQSSQVCLGDRCQPCNRLTKSYNVCMVQSKSKKMVHGNEWFYGSELFREFMTKGTASSVGCSIRVQRGQAMRISNARARQLTGEDVNFPIQLDRDVIFAQKRRIPRYRHTDSTPMLTVRVFDI